MAVDVNSLIGKIWQGIQGSLTNLGPTELGAAQQEVSRLAQALAEIEGDVAAGSITSAQAQGYMQSQVQYSLAIFTSLAGMTAPTAVTIMKTALQVLADAAAAAAGLGWATPIINGIIDGLGGAGGQ